MAERLDDIAYGQTGSSNTFNPRSVSLDIRTPEELAAVNQFLVTLGRDVSAPRQSLHSSNPHSSLSSNYFDAANLAQLGLSDMPGLPGVNDFSGDQSYAVGHQYPNGSYSSRSVPVPLSNIYATMETSLKYNGHYNPGRSAQQYQGSYGTHYQYSTPSMDGGSPHSTISTPVTTNPQVLLPMSDFDFQRMRSIPHVAHLAPPEYSSKPMRSMVALKSLPLADRPALVEHPSLAQSSQRSIELPSLSDRKPVLISKPESLYPMLTPGDKRVTLPPLSAIYRSPSSRLRSYHSAPHSHKSSSVESSFGSGHAILPSFSSIDLLAPRERQCEDQLVNDVKMMDLEKRDLISREQRKRHANLILELLVKINGDFKNKYGQPISLPQDVEMITA